MIKFFPALLCLTFAACALAAPATQPTDAPGDPVLEEPTLHCLGAYWIMPDAATDLRIDMEYRKAGDAEWRKSMPMFRVRAGDTTQTGREAQLNPAEGTTLFAGSVVNLAPNTEYELRLTPCFPAGAAGKVLKARTAAEPTDPPNPLVRHVVPGKGGGDGSEKDPYKGLDYAQSEARPGTILLLHKGTYEGTFNVTRSGQPGKPIIWRAAGDGEATIDGGGTEKVGIDAVNVHDVRFEKLSVKGFFMGMSITDSSRIVIRRCRISQVKCGIYCNSSQGQVELRNFFIADNELDGPFTWGEGPVGASVVEWRGIQITGIGHDVCYNRIRNFKDGIDTFPSRFCAAIDFHHNEIINAKDDGIEMDFSERNNRCFENRLTNIHQGITEQPIFGGPVYIFRNALYNVGVEPFKLHHNGTPQSGRNFWPSGAILYHNTIVKKGDPFILYSAGPVYNCVTRNNLFVGGGKRAMSFDPPMEGCDFDYDGFAGGPWDLFMKWNGVRYQTVDEVHAKSPAQKHSLQLDAATLFATGAERPTDTDKAYDPTDLRPNPASPAAAAGQPLPGFNDGFKGKAPSLGAYEAGADLPHYGPRPEK